VSVTTPSAGSPAYRRERPRPAASARFVAPAALSDFPEPDLKRWPGAVRAAFVLLSCGGFWSAVGLAVAHGLAR
jgi:hypothetical protein